MNKENAKNDLKVLFERNVFHKINVAIAEYDKNEKDNKQKKSLRKKLIIGICITLILSLVILYFNLIAGTISFAVGVYVLVIYGICKSKLKKIQGNPQILLNVLMNEQTTE